MVHEETRELRDQTQIEREQERESREERLWKKVKDDREIDVVIKSQAFGREIQNLENNRQLPEEFREITKAQHGGSKDYSEICSQEDTRNEVQAQNDMVCVDLDQHSSR